MKKILITLAAAALPLSAASATVSVGAGDPGDPYNGPTPDIDFSAPDSRITGGEIVSGSTDGEARAPVGTDDPYYSVGPLAGSPAVLDLSSIGDINVISLVWGSVDLFNTIEVLDAANNVIQTLTGADILAAFGDGAIIGRTDALVFLSFGGGTEADVNALRFSSTNNAFEFDNIAINPVPEPGTWMMLLLGFAGIGASLRRRKKVAKAAYA